MTAVPTAMPGVDGEDHKALIEGTPSKSMQVVLWAFVFVPFAAVAVGIPLAWIWGLGPTWLDLILIVVTYYVSTTGIGVGFHRHFTHGSFKAKRPLRIALAVAGSLGIEGNIIQWVADHRRHHQFSDKEGDPHSPWAYGESVWGLTKGFLHAHVGWILHREFSNRRRFAPDLLDDSDIRRIDKLFPVFVVASLAGPAVFAGLVMWSWTAALSAFFWAGLVRVALLHHVTWSINSVCHMVGKRPFAVRKNKKDRAANVWWLAILSQGESWHNLHHADPTCARHGVLPGQVDINARTIWACERLGWTYEVKWPTPERLTKLRAENAAA